MRLIISMVSLAVAVLPALADRQVTEDERAKLSAAVQAEGCSGGKFELDEDDQQLRSTMPYARMERNMTSSSICRCS
jgi:hypothetical protein